MLLTRETPRVRYSKMFQHRGQITRSESRRSIHRPVYTFALWYRFYRFPGGRNIRFSEFRRSQRDRYDYFPKPVEMRKERGKKEKAPFQFLRVYIESESHLFA